MDRRNNFILILNSLFMKVIFEPKDKEKLPHDLSKIAKKYNTNVKKHDTGEGHFIFVKSKIKISEKFKDNSHYIHVWGATDEDISFLKQFWGEPIRIIEQKMSPLEFATELIEIPQIETLSVEEIIQTMRISERDFRQYSRFIQMASRKSDILEDVKKAYTILENL